jgi:hypothetical protein
MDLLLSTAIFPPVTYMAACAGCSRIILECEETYTKQTFRNRYRIFGPNGVQVLSIPVIKTEGNHTRIRNIRIGYDIQWQKIHWRSVETAYNNSPFFLYYRDHFEKFFLGRFDFLLDLNTEILSELFRILGISAEIGFTEKYEKSPSCPDMRTRLATKHGIPGAAFQPYEQPFREKHGFQEDLSILDLIFNLGPEASEYLEKHKAVLLSVI